MRVATKVDKAVDAIEDTYDTARAIDRIGDGLDTSKTISKATKTKGWQLGDDVRNLTKAGNDPSWTTVRQRYWKNQAYYNPNKYPNDLERMKRGLAPIGCDGFPMELHHPNRREGANFYIFKPLTRTEHRYRHYGK